MAYNNNNQNQYYNNYNNTNNDYYDDQEVPSTSTSSNNRVQELNQKYLPKINTGNNNSTRSLGGATVVETPRVNPTENADDADSIDSSLYLQNNRQAHQQFYGQPKLSVDEGESRAGSISTKRDSTIAQPLIGQSAYELGDMGDQHYHNHNQNRGPLPQYNNYHRQSDYYDEEATRHNTLTSGDPNSYGFENDYTDRDFPGGGKGARQSMTGEQLAIPEKKKRKGCCGCCSWPICLLITLIILTGLGVTVFFVIPRVPTVNVKDAVPISQPILSVNPPSVNMDFNMIVAIGNEKNYVPYKFNKIEVTVFNRAVDTNTPVATGTKLDYTLQPKTNDVLEFPLTVNYSAKDRNDPIIQNFVAACSPEVKQHTPLKLKVDVELSVWGIDWIYKPKISVNVPDMKCPIPNKFNKL